MNDRARNDNGLSDALGAVVLIAVVAMGITIAGMAILSSPVPDRVPALNAEVTNTSDIIFIRHTGGDTLVRGEYRILADGIDRTDQFLSGSTMPAQWSVGDTLEYSIPTGTPMPASIQIVAITGNGEQMIQQVQVRPPTFRPTSSIPPTATTTTSTTSTTTTAVPTTTSEPTGTVTTTTTTTPVTVHQVYLNKESQSDLVEGTYIQFRVTGLYSTIQHSSTTYSLKTGDTVRLTIGNDHKGQIYATSSTINTFDFNNVRLMINGSDMGTANINSIWVSGYDTYTSTLTLNVPSHNAWTNLVVDGSTLISGTNNSQITVTGLAPSGGVMNLNNAAGTTYYTGGAVSYTLS